MYNDKLTIFDYPSFNSFPSLFFITTRKSKSRVSFRLFLRELVRFRYFSVHASVQTVHHRFAHCFCQFDRSSVRLMSFCQPVCLSVFLSFRPSVCLSIFSCSTHSVFEFGDALTLTLEEILETQNVATESRLLALQLRLDFLQMRKGKSQ